MVGKDLLFRWEDSPALRHHCGFCGRPLSHPGAKASCFGPHAEPCSRFHQAMFMRNKSHTCNMCATADEAHSKRHNEIADRLRDTYDIWGEDWPIVAVEESERKQARTCEDDELDEDYGCESLSKKERKEHKRLIRAASRPRFVTYEDRIHIGLVLHATDRQENASGPNTTEQIAEIEKHLRYNAQVYNEGAKRSVMKGFAELSGADVDFEGEMTRIMDTFRITELQKHNTTSGGLRGKSLKVFNTLVSEFKELVVEDLLLLKKEELEIRMRRAGYLRYTNRASFDIIRNRYEGKDWRTGEKHSTYSPQLTDNLTSISEHDGDDEAENDDGPLPIPAAHMTADTRHIHRGHRKIRSDGELGDVVTHSPSLASSTYGQHERVNDRPNSSLKKPRCILSIKAPSPQPTRLSVRATPSPSTNSWQHIVKNSRDPLHKTPLQPVTNAWLSSTNSIQNQIALSMPSALSSPSEVAVKEMKSQMEENISPAHKRDSIKQQETKPTPAATPAKAPTDPVSFETRASKKLKKKKREAERKARRAEEQAASSVTSDNQPYTPNIGGQSVFSPYLSSSDMPEEDFSLLCDAELTSPTSVDSFSLSDHKFGIATELHSSSETRAAVPFAVKKYSLKNSVAYLEPALATGKNQLESRPPASELLLQPVQPPTPSDTSSSGKSTSSAKPPIIPKTKHGRPSNWKEYTKWLQVDTLTRPTHEPFCSRTVPCPFEATDTLDCQFYDHAPYRSCHDPRADICYVVYPRDDSCSIGPFSRCRATKLLKFFDSQAQTKRQLTIIDGSIKDWVSGEASIHSLESPPFPRPLQYEVDDYAFGLGKGRLMLQTEKYRALRVLNRLTDQQPISNVTLIDLQRVCEPTGMRTVCYCEDIIPNKEDIIANKGDVYVKEKRFAHLVELIRCSHVDCHIKFFHRKCVEHQGIDKVSKWYCYSCALYMKEDVSRVLEELECMRKKNPLPRWPAKDA